MKVLKIFLIMFTLLICGCNNGKKITNQEIQYFYDENGKNVQLKNGKKQIGDMLIYQYDQNGNVSKIILKDEKSEIINKQQYDENGNLTKSEDFLNSKLIGFTTFNSNGLTSSSNYVDANGEVATFNYEYEGQNITKQSKIKNNEIVYTQQYKTDENAKTSIETTTKEGKKTFTLDENIVKETLTDSKGNIIYQYEKNGVKNSQKYSHYENGVVDKVLECLLDENKIREEKYKNNKIISATESDLDGNKLKDEEYKNGKLAGYVQYIRENGKLVGRKTYSADNKLKRHYKYITKNGITQIFTYDAAGNLVEYED